MSKRRRHGRSRMKSNAERDDRLERNKQGKFRENADVKMEKLMKSNENLRRPPVVSLFIRCSLTKRSIKSFINFFSFRTYPNNFLVRFTFRFLGQKGLKSLLNVE